MGCGNAEVSKLQNQLTPRFFSSHLLQKQNKSCHVTGQNGHKEQITKLGIETIGVTKIEVSIIQIRIPLCVKKSQYDQTNILGTEIVLETKIEVSLVT